MEQLLRTLNLNSPAPYAYGGASEDVITSSASPDVSPISTTSGLHTPPDISPAKAYGEWKFNPSYDFGPVYQTQPDNALLFETENPFRYHDLVNVPQAATFRPSHSVEPFQAQARGFPFAGPLSERPTPAPTNDAFTQVEYPTTHLRQDSIPLSAGLWSQQRLRTSSAEWLKPEERRLVDHSALLPQSDHHSMRTGNAHGNAHEVC